VHKQLVEGRITFTQLEIAISNGAKALAELEIQKKNNENVQYRAVSCWLNSPDVKVDHESISDVRATNPNSGQWLLQHDLFLAWKDSNNIDSMLWLCGIPGAGMLSFHRKGTGCDSGLDALY
jgi:hypothetical protein